MSASYRPVMRDQLSLGPWHSGRCGSGGAGVPAALALSGYRRYRLHAGSGHPIRIWQAVPGAGEIDLMVSDHEPPAVGRARPHLEK